MSYKIAIESAEAFARSRVFSDYLKATEASCMCPVDSEYVYVAYDTEEHRDAAYEAMKERFRSARRVYALMKESDHDDTDSVG